MGETGMSTISGLGTLSQIRQNYYGIKRSGKVKFEKREKEKKRK